MQEPGHGPNTMEAHLFLAQGTVLLGGAPGPDQRPAVTQGSGAVREPGLVETTSGGAGSNGQPSLPSSPDWPEPSRGHT